MFFTFDNASRTGSVKGDGWDITYSGHPDALSAWSAVAADGFALKPGTDLVAGYGNWTAQVVR